jgi:hypothetical protein
MKGRSFILVKQKAPAGGHTSRQNEIFSLFQRYLQADDSKGKGSGVFP